jgi:predicted ester cyclase
MNQIRHNKELVIRYFNAISGNVKTRGLMEQFITDEELIGHVQFFETVFPKYEMFADEMTAEGNHVVVRARMKGIHAGQFNGIPPTYKNVEFPFVINYEIENGKIVHHWIIADQTILMEQLGLSGVHD